MAFFNIDKIKSELKLGGARPCLFNIQATLPGALESGTKDIAERKLEFLCQAASLPGETITPVELSYQGRKFYVAGNRTFAPWTITVINDEDFLIRNVFEEWMEGINGKVSNIRGLGISSEPIDYKGVFIVKQFSKDNQDTPLRKYKLEGCFPTEISPIEVNWATENEVETFTVTIQYDLHYLDQDAE